MRRSLWAVVVGLALLVPGPALAQVDDSEISVDRPSSIEDRRESLREFLWGTESLPTTKATVEAGIALPIPAITGVLRSDRLTMAMSDGVTTQAWHLVPSVARKNRAVLVHNGHNNCNFDDRATQTLPFWPPGSGQDGMWWTVQNLITEGYDVVAMFMPRYSPNDCQLAGDVHGALGTIPVTPGSPLKFFLEPVVRVLNYLAGLRTFTDFSMTGLSGGGWTTHVAAAIDPRIKLSIPVAGSIPLYINAAGDYEQVLADFYNIAGYPDLYVMGAYGRDREQVQVVNRRDSCCFGETAYSYTQTTPGWYEEVLAYSYVVRNVVRKATRGAFRLYVDEGASHHTISYNAQVNVILAELNGARRPVGASTASNAFTESSVGKLMRTTTSAHTNTNVGISGTPAVLEAAEHTVDVFFADDSRPGWKNPEWAGGDIYLGDLGPSRRLRQAWLTGSTWSQRELPTPALGIISDPVAVSTGAGSWDVVALGGDYRLYRWWWRSGFSTPSMEMVNGRDEVQTVTVTGSPTGGTFTLAFEGQTSAAIAHNATSRQVRSALEALSNIFLYDVTVTGGPLPATPVVVQFTNSLGASNRGEMTAASSLTGGTSPQAAVSTTTGGVTGTKVAGQPAMTLSTADKRHVIVPNFSRRLLHFSQDGTGGSWVEEATSSPDMTNHPSVVWDGTNVKVYGRALSDGKVHQGVLTGGTWAWAVIPASPAATGSPSASFASGTTRVQTRTTNGRTLTMTFASGAWTFRSGKSALADSPTAVPTGAWARRPDGALIRWTTNDWVKEGTVFD